MLAASIVASALACLVLLPGVVCQVSEEEIVAATDVIFLPWSARLREGASLNSAKLCWWHEYPDDFLKHSYRQCCCAGPAQSLQCWDGDTSAGPPRACCHYRYGPGTTCFPLHGRVRLQFPGLPVLSAHLKPSEYEYEPHFAALLTQGHLLEPRFLSSTLFATFLFWDLLINTDYWEKRVPLTLNPQPKPSTPNPEP